MPRSKVVTVAGKTITLHEKRIGELEALAERVGASFDEVLGANGAKDLKSALTAVLYGKLPELFPELSAEDVRNAYPSELEGLLEAFVEVNFQGVRRVAGPLIGLVQAGLTRRFSSASDTPSGGPPATSAG
ncbi:MAG: hypothetical protein M1598_01970 [Actinobacteria bacterium]|nr:hypothetical protein [Actinomycetota bacterium]